MRRLALLSAPYAYSMTAHLLSGEAGPDIELRATTAAAPYGAAREFVRHVPFAALELEGPVAIARDFARETRSALAAKPAGTRHRKLRS